MRNLGVIYKKGREVRRGGGAWEWSSGKGWG